MNSELFSFSLSSRGCCCEAILISQCQHSYMQPSIMLITTDVNTHTDVHYYTHTSLIHTLTHAAGKSSSRDVLSGNKLMVFSFTPSQTRLCTLLCWKPDWWAPCQRCPPSNICADFPRMLEQHTFERQLSPTWECTVTHRPTCRQPHANAESQSAEGMWLCTCFN